VLTSSYIHVPGIGEKTERLIWSRGAHSWRAFLDNPAAVALSAQKTRLLEYTIAESLARLTAQDHAYFARMLAPREHWRAFPDFGHRIAYLDIETTGLNDYDAVTIIGVFDGTEVRIYTKDEDLPEFVEDIGQYQLLVTFCGTCFDLPFLRRRFLNLRFDQLHIDLCYALRRLDLRGGLKNIERQLGLSRSPETEGLDGWDAVRLWREWERGSREALDLLKAYNREDIVHLETLLRHAYHGLRAKLGMPEV
jgi:uncharacterized protein